MNTRYWKTIVQPVESGRLSEWALLSSCVSVPNQFSARRRHGLVAKFSLRTRADIGAVLAICIFYFSNLVALGWISRKVLKHGISLVLRYVLCSYLSLFYL